MSLTVEATIDTPEYSAEEIATLRKLADDNDADANFKLGNFYRSNGQHKNFNKAIGYYSKAIDIAKHPGALNNLALMYQNGTGIASTGNQEQRYQVALSFFERAAKQGILEATTNIASLCLIEKDHQKALELFEETAEKGEPGAQYNLGWIYYDGNIVDKDDEKALQLWQNAEENGLEIAQYTVAEYYHKEVLDNGFYAVYVEKALKGYKPFAEKGDSNAQMRMAHLYKTANKHREAFNLYKEAIDNGNEEASQLLREMCVELSKSVTHELHLVKKPIGPELIKEQAFVAEIFDFLAAQDGKNIRYQWELVTDKTLISKARMSLSQLRGKNIDFSTDDIYALSVTDAANDLMQQLRKRSVETMRKDIIDNINAMTGKEDSRKIRNGIHSRVNQALSHHKLTGEIGQNFHSMSQLTQTIFHGDEKEVRLLVVGKSALEAAEAEFSEDGSTATLPQRDIAL